MPPLLTIENLHVRFATDEGPLHAVDGVSLDLSRGEVLCVVGESGCGKSALAMSIPGLLPTPPASRTADRIELDGIDLLHLPPRELCAIRGRRIGVVFQEPMTALSPLHRIGNQVEEAIRLHRPMAARDLRLLALDWLGRVGLADPARAYSAWPHELSGGMQQRVMIAMALVNDPDLVIADEPTTALDVTTQAQVLALMRRLIRKESGLLLITHDMGVVSEMATRVAVMYAGQIVETAPCDELFRAPRHPYTRALLAALPSSATRGRRLPVIPGSVPSPLDWPAGCRFRDRCAFAGPGCAEPPPVLSAGEGHRYRCGAAIAIDRR
ncbi:MAG: ABC transporter ATP-binding protein [Kiritimatiellae bacterium]|nr:ABC transporter ATP-binding protein [Kiritimatiellia bacterium]